MKAGQALLNLAPTLETDRESTVPKFSRDLIVGYAVGGQDDNTGLGKHALRQRV